jgi:hypothetical protein
MRQYAFTPQETDPRVSANDHWDDMRQELNVTRDALESANAHEIAQASLIDMLRKELAATKENCAIIERSNTVMRTKLQAASMLVIDALKSDEIERGEAVSEFAVRKPAVPRADPNDASEVVRNIHALANKWP